jgi:hypothetical protein
MKYLAAILMFIFFTDACSQKVVKNAFYIEVGGNAGFYSINYEHTFFKNTIGRIGFSCLPGDLIFPVLIGRYFGDKASHLELMGGVGYGHYRHKDVTDVIHTSQEVLGTASVSYRYQNPKQKFLFRVGYTPFINFSVGSLRHWAGISAGYRF